MESTALAVAEIGGILLGAAVAGYLARLAGLSAIVGYLAVGLLVSPFTPGYVADRHQIQLLADIGVVLLLFEIGIEIDLGRLRRESGGVLIAAPIQVVVTAAAGLGLASAMGAQVQGGALFGLAVALSSSVVVANIARSRRRTASQETAGMLLGWSVLQDLAGTGVALVVISLLGLNGASIGLTLARIVAFIGLALGASRILPIALQRVGAEPDLFLLMSVSSALLIAGLGAKVFGVPLAIAAFVGGLTVGEHGHVAAAREALLPFRDLFAVLFFVAVGTLFDPLSLQEAWPWALVTIGLVLVAKAVPTLVLVRYVRVAGIGPAQVATGLAQVGEFSFVLGSLGASHGFLPETAYAGLLAAMVVTIPLSSLLARMKA